MDNSYYDRELYKFLLDAPIEDLHDQLVKAQTLMTYYQCALFEVETKFKVLNEQLSLLHEQNPIDSIKTRLKSPDSIGKKLKLRNLPLTLESIEENLFDIAGIRVICPFVDDIYMLADSLIRQDDVTLIEQKDYIKTPKKNGYRSLHLIIQIPIYLQHEKRDMKVEVQLRTIAMEFWANTEHRLRYKKELPPYLANKISAEMKQCAMLSAMLDGKVRKIKYDLETALEEERLKNSIPSDDPFSDIAKNLTPQGM